MVIIFCACYFAREYIIWALEYHVHWMYTMLGVKTKHDKFYTIRNSCRKCRLNKQAISWKRCKDSLELFVTPDSWRPDLCRPFPPAFHEPWHKLQYVTVELNFLGMQLEEAKAWSILPEPLGLLTMGMLPQNLIKFGYPNWCNFYQCCRFYTSHTQILPIFCHKLLFHMPSCWAAMNLMNRPVAQLCEMKTWSLWVVSWQPCCE